MVSLLLAVALFALLFSLLFSKFGAFGPIFRIAIMFALPVWCLCLPIVIAVKDLEERGMLAVLLSGSLIGPVSLGFWFLFLQLRGANQDQIWHGDPLAGVGGISSMLYSLIIGFLTTFFYMIALRILRRRPVESRLRSI